MANLQRDGRRHAAACGRHSVQLGVRRQDVERLAVEEQAHHPMTRPGLCRSPAVLQATVPAQQLNVAGALVTQRSNSGAQAAAVKDVTHRQVLCPDHSWADTNLCTRKTWPLRAATASVTASADHADSSKTFESELPRRALRLAGPCLVAAAP